ncbi:MAG TPA: hypothetical protein VJ044_16945, partial [Candidatus Hodarchaeales archaeon]|nr:hypothetical protein [Candidatus Hodarchaeales archaeon]
VNFGTAEGYRQSGYLKMIWDAQSPACQFCQSMDGTIVSIGKPFISRGDKIEGTDGGEYIADYDDVDYADLHPYCDCRLLPYKED